MPLSLGTREVPTFHQAGVLGIPAGLLFLGYGVGMLPSNLALERFGAPLWLSFLVIGWGISSGLMAAVRGVHAFYIIRVRRGTFGD